MSACRWRAAKEAELLCEKHVAGCAACQASDLSSEPLPYCRTGESLLGREAATWMEAGQCRAVSCGDPHPDCPRVPGVGSAAAPGEST